MANIHKHERVGDDDPGYEELDPTGRYGRFKEILGKGAHKTVYRAFDEVNGTEVAWNQMRVVDVMSNPAELQRLYSEIDVLEKVDHESIIKFYGSWINKETRTINFITEMFTSGSLREYRKKYKRISIEAIKNWSRQILSGLAYLHSQNPPIIHRDLKCDNILINGHSGEVKIGDLGLAVLLTEGSAAHSCLGTPEYMAPELYEENYNELVDIYSFGMCVLEMLTLDYPFSECTNTVHIYKKVTSGKKPESLSLVKHPEAKRFILRCLQPVSQRPSAEDLLLYDPFLISMPSADNTASTSLSSILGPPTPKSIAIPVHNKKANLSPRAKPNAGGGGGNWITGTRIVGARSLEGVISITVHIPSENGMKDVSFPFNTKKDTAMEVATEMVRDLEIMDKNSVEIANLIDDEISRLVPEWKSNTNEDDDDEEPYDTIEEDNLMSDVAADHDSNMSDSESNLLSPSDESHDIGFSEPAASSNQLLQRNSHSDSSLQVIATRSHEVEQSIYYDDHSDDNSTSGSSGTSSFFSPTTQTSTDSNYSTTMFVVEEVPECPSPKNKTFRFPLRRMMSIQRFFHPTANSQENEGKGVLLKMKSSNDLRSQVALKNIFEGSQRTTRTVSNAESFGYSQGKQGPDWGERMK